MSETERSHDHFFFKARISDTDSAHSMYALSMEKMRVGALSPKDTESEGMKLKESHILKDPQIWKKMMVLLREGGDEGSMPRGCGVQKHKK